jgi:hypothetical protein
MKNVKDLLVDYTANKIRRREVSIQDIMELLDREFPEFLEKITKAYYQAGYDDAVKGTITSDNSDGKKIDKRSKNKGRRINESDIY